MYEPFDHPKKCRMRRRCPVWGIPTLALMLLGCQAAPQPIAVSWSKMAAKQIWISVTVSGKGEKADPAWKAQAAAVCGTTAVPLSPLEVVTTTRGDSATEMAQGVAQCASEP